MLSHKHLLKAGLIGVLLSLGSAASAQICTREYAPVCGQVAGAAAPQTFSNRCMLNAAGATFIAEGACTAAPKPPAMIVGGDVDAHGCKPSTGYAWNEALASCVRPWMTSVITLEVSSRQKPCFGKTEQQCLVVREINPGKKAKPWQQLPGEIEGFQHQAGVRHTLRVRKDRVAEPAAGASGFTYQLLKVLK